MQATLALAQETGYAKPPRGPLHQALIGEAQYDPAVAAGLNERFIRRQTDNRPPTQGGP